jgi:hypothetical protein
MLIFERNLMESMSRVARRERSEWQMRLRPALWQRKTQTHRKDADRADECRFSPPTLYGKYHWLNA